MIQQRDTQRLTKRVIDRASCPPVGQIFLRDTDLPGFGVRLTKGQKTFILEKRIKGRRRRLTIGPYGPLTVEQARDRAEHLAGRIANGEDPAQERLDTQHEATFGELIAMYQERHGPRKKTARADKNRLERHAADWKTWRLSAIARAEVAKRHGRIGSASPYEANRLLALLSRMFNLGRVWGVFSGENPTLGVERFPEVKRDRFVQPDELPRLFKALDAEPDPYVKTAFIVSLLTGARIGEVVSMQWDHLSLDQALWRLPETKAGRPHLLPLPGPVLEALRALPRLEGNPHVFPSHGTRGHLTDLSRAWARLCERAQLSDLRIHDLRRTLGSWLAVSGASLTLIGKVLNHSQLSTTQVYARLNLDPVRGGAGGQREEDDRAGQTEQTKTETAAMKKRPLVPVDYRGTPRCRPYVVPPAGSPPAPEDPYSKVLDNARRAREQRGDKVTRPAPSSILSRLPVLRETSPEPFEPSADPLLDLHQLHGSEQRTPYDAWRAVLLAGEAGVPAPPWAVETFRDLWKRRHQDTALDLNVELGFRAKGRGKTSQVERALRARRIELSMNNIWCLTLLGYSVEQACEIEANRILSAKGWNRTAYDIAYSATGDIASSLETEWKKWKKTDTHRINAAIESWTRQDLMKHRQEFLAEFPSATAT